MASNIKHMGAALGPLSGHSGRFEVALQQAAQDQQAQQALDALRQRTPALVWRSARGEYAVEDAATHRWYEGRVAKASWPPASSQRALALDRD